MTTCSASSLASTTLVWSDLGPRDQLRVTGADACSFIENFTTNRVSSLKVGEGCVSFFCDARGWVLELALIRRLEDGLIIDVGFGRAAPLLVHLDRYHIREQLAICDISAQETGLLMLGRASIDWLRQHFQQPLPENPQHFIHGCLKGDSGFDLPVPLRLTRLDWYGQEGFLLEGTAAEVKLLTSVLTTAAAPLSLEQRTARRLLRGWPLANDIPEKTLPQELDLTEQTICFTKGCYLGQETVARLDALGHINRKLTVLVVEGESSISKGALVVVGDKMVAKVSSVASWDSPACWLAMAIIPIQAINQCDALTVDGRPATVLSAKNSQGGA